MAGHGAERLDVGRDVGNHGQHAVKQREKFSLVAIRNELVE